MLITQALQEWDAVCQALAAGSCSVLLRKGGIHDEDGLFKPAAEHFALMPSYLHQDEARLRQHALPASEQREQQRSLLLWAQCTDVFKVEQLDTLLDLAEAGHWPWASSEIEKRFLYRNKPYLYVLLLRCYRFPEIIWLDDDGAFAGCKSWFAFADAIDCQSDQPVLDSATYNRIKESLSDVIGREDK